MREEELKNVIGCSHKIQSSFYHSINYYLTFTISEKHAEKLRALWEEERNVWPLTWVYQNTGGCHMPICSAAAAEKERGGVYIYIYI